VADNTQYGAGQYGAGIYNVYAVQPGSAADAETIGAPSAGASYLLQPGGIGDGEAFGGPAITVAYPITPTSIRDIDTMGAPAATGSGQVAPPGIDDPETFGAPTVVSYGYLPYGTGNYGQGTYNGGSISATSVSPAGIIDGQTIDRPELSGTATILPISNEAYGAGTYGQGMYAGAPVEPTEHWEYGTGPYGTGTFYGLTRPAVPPRPESQPPLYEYSDLPLPPQQILGIGPWSPIVVYRGAINVGVGKGKRPAAPIMRMPASTGLSYTLRLDGGNEATASFALPRGSAIIIEEMHTDLWWRRKDPNTGAVETIGRFNASSNDLSSDGSAITSSVHWVDYTTLLGERLVLKYLTTVLDSGGHVTSATSMWNTGTPVAQIMRFAIPTNMGLDLSAIQPGSATDLGLTTDKFTLPPDSTIADLFTNLLPISKKKWEWWIEQPDDVTAAPVLRFEVGTRGNPTHVVLYDLGTGASPIDSWTMTAATTQYANALYYTGGGIGSNPGGGVIYTIDAQIQEFGQRDAKDGDSNLTVLEHLQARAKSKLAALADRRPTFTVKLRAGFWGGRAHIDVGDSIRLVLKMGAETLDYSYRVSEIAVDIDEYGVENVTLTLGTPRPSGDPRSRHSAVLRLVRRILNYVVPPGADGSTGTTPTS
jgi:hypothetical protein